MTSGIPTSSTWCRTSSTDIYHLSQEQIYNGGYVIRTSIDDKKMAALYAAVREQRGQINASSHPFHPRYMHAAAVLEDPGSGAIQARVRRAGLPRCEVQRDRQGHHRELCVKILCECNMAV